MARLDFLTLENILQIHADTIANDGGSDGLRDRGLIDAAINMPRQTFGGQHLHNGIPEMAAAYLFHICQAHAFVDGNKRVALLAADVFLDVNGWDLTASATEVEAVVLAVADGKMIKSEVTDWFTRVCAPRKAR